PTGSEPASIPADNLVSPYLTHILMPKIYNGAQTRNPFQITLTQEGINDIIVRQKWPAETRGLTFYAPKLYITESALVIMGRFNTDLNLEFAYTAVISVEFGKAGAALNLESFRLGYVNITPVAKAILKRSYEHFLAKNGKPIPVILQKIVSSLIDSEPFDPAFEIKGNNFRLSGFSPDKGGLKVSFEPIESNLAEI
ncbi:MAG: hypothetical protein H8D47_01345, partial [Planctomycetes bacterium]|nr:hypothetical protein [Planctomycetota bacterium]